MGLQGYSHICFASQHSLLEDSVIYSQGLSGNYRIGEEEGAHDHSDVMRTVILHIP